jgi:hypothetical protein
MPFDGTPLKIIRTYAIDPELEPFASIRRGLLAAAERQRELDRERVPEAALCDGCAYRCRDCG